MIDMTEVRQALVEMEIDGWLLFDFHGLNPVAGRVLDLTGMNTRRLFVLLPREGEPIAVAHKIELQGLAKFPGRVVPYARWSELHAALGSLVNGRTLAMEISPEDAVPYLDRVPFGVVELLRGLGATLVPSGSLVSRFAARWSRSELEDHRAAAEILAGVARTTLMGVVHRAHESITESSLQGEVVTALEAAGLVMDDPPIVAFGANSANPHYGPSPRTLLKAGDVVLLDLWAGRSHKTVFADQTWIGFAGDRPSDQVREVWRTVRNARDAAITAVRQASAERRPISGYEADRAARAVIERAGYGEWFVHRTGHSIDRDLHGSGPHLDDYETHDDRQLIHGIGFSVEPGIYLPGAFGMRSEVNVYMGEAGPEVTPGEPQMELITAESAVPSR
jgi:Xaa-Pro dipeptidase